MKKGIYINFFHLVNVNQLILKLIKMSGEKRMATHTNALVVKIPRNKDISKGKRESVRFSEE